MPTNIPPSLGFKNVYREAPFSVSLILPDEITPPSSVTIRVFFKDVLQEDVHVNATVVGQIVSWTFSVEQLRLAVGQKAKFDVLFNDGLTPVCGNVLLPILDYEIPVNEDIVVKLFEVGNTRVVFTGDAAAAREQADRAESAADRAEEARDAALTISAGAFENKGDWNAATNTPTLTANATIGQTNPAIPQRYVIVTGGALPFAIKNKTAGTVISPGYLVQHPNGQWFYDPSDSLALAKIGVIEPLVPGIPITTEELTNGYRPAIVDLAKKGLLVVSPEGQLLGWYDLSLSNVPLSSLPDNIVNGVIRSFDMADLPPNSDIVMAYDLTGVKPLIRFSPEGQMKAWFDLTGSYIPIESLPEAVVSGLIQTYDAADLPTGMNHTLARDAVGKQLISVEPTGRLKFWADLTGCDFPPSPNRWIGKSAVWVGTSIPWAFGSNAYPMQIGRMLGLSAMYNNSISGHRMMFFTKTNSETGVTTTYGGIAGTLAENAPVGQNNSYEFLIKLYLAPPYNAKIVFIDYGTNDIPFLGPYPEMLGDINSFDKGTIYGALNCLIRDILTPYPEVRIVLCTCPNSYWYNTGGSNVYALTELVNTAIRTVAYKKKCGLLDWGSFSGINEYTAAAGKLTGTDDLHPDLDQTTAMSWMGYNYSLGV